MARIFVSYSHKNTDFCKRLTDGLLLKQEMDFWVDWEGIPPTVDWMKEIEKGIEEADTFLAIVTPEWIASKVCNDELAIAVKNGKRMIPVVAYKGNWNDVPPALAQFNYIPFTEDFDYNTQLDKLFTALDTDYDWLKTHRRLQVKALDWERGNKEGGFLLHGKDLEEAEQQISINANKDPHPTDIQREYVLLSRQGATRQRRITTGILVFIIFMLVGISAYFATPRIQEAIAKNKARGELILIPAGATIFGTKNPEYIGYGFVPQQEIQFDAFEIGKFEVTNYQYNLCVQYGNCTVPVDPTAFRDISKQDHPVVYVNVYQANNYCNWLGQRLPTELEWERTARGSNGDPWPWTWQHSDQLYTELANMPAPGIEQTNGTQPVNSNTNGVSPDGIYNLVGNVWEWTSSYWYEGGEYDVTRHWNSLPETFKGADNYTIRGGGWNNEIIDVSQNNPMTGKDEDREVGFRCAEDVQN